MDPTILARQLAMACAAGTEAALKPLVAEFGFADPRRSAANLKLLHAVVPDCSLLAAVALAALQTADPDLALNSLEQLTNTAWQNELLAVLGSERERRQLLTVLGASPFLTGILCRKPDHFHDLFAAGELRRAKDEATMLAELRQRIPSEATFAELQKGLRLYK
ncbi:MAG TPA: bifunctional [glutamate--ammonia ligase]-adenylyl-L-tyrosine phosphorylase/[glutamate--ammonia-ligase] adenylyltransferase, partial [Desulfuromonadales bacterium]